MYQEHHLHVAYQSVADRTLLQEPHRKLFDRAIEASLLAYAPYSRFRVGAAALLNDGSIITGSNRENASFPAGICAERNVLHYVGDHAGDQRILALAIAANPMDYELNDPVTPCGICRQVIREHEHLHGTMEIIAGSTSGNILIFKSGKDLLPLGFYLEELRKQ